MSGDPDGSCPSAGVAVGHAWSAAEPEDEQRLLEHLPTCAACEAVIVDALAVGAELAAAVPPRDPPPALRARILAAVAAEPGPSPRPGEAVPPSVAPTPASPGATPPRPDRPARPRRAVGGLLLVSVAVVLGVVLLAGRALLPGSSGTEQAAPGREPTPAALAAQAARVVDDAEAADPGVRHAVLRDGDGRSVAVVLDGSGGSSGPEASPRVVTLALATPPAGRAWVLWGTGTGTPAALGPVDRSTGRPVDGAGAPAPAPGGGWRGFAVSEEPAGPVPLRPTEVLATGSVV